MGYAPPFDLSGKTALVTGAGRGLGAEFAVGLAEAGANVAVLDINEEALRGTGERLEQLGISPLTVPCDVGDEDGFQQVLESCLDRFDRLDILVNNAGIGDAQAKPLGDLDMDEWRRVLRVNLDGVAICCKAALGPMQTSGGGKIINISSMYALRAAAAVFPLPAYVASKGAVLSLTAELAVEYASWGITVNALCPGFVRTGIAGPGLDNPAFRERLARMNPLGRIAEPEEFRGVIVFLASAASDYMTGQTLILDGGYTVR